MPRHSPCALISFTICSSRLYLSSLTKKLFFSFYLLLNLYWFFISTHSPHFAFSALLCYSVFKLPSLYPLKNTFQYIHYQLLINLYTFKFILYSFWVGTSGLEPPTSRLSGVRSNHLSYAPFFLWRWGESNSWPPACKAGALPAELHPRLVSSKLNNYST